MKATENKQFLCPENKFGKFLLAKRKQDIQTIEQRERRLLAKRQYKKQAIESQQLIKTVGKQYE